MQLSLMKLRNYRKFNNVHSVIYLPIYRMNPFSFFFRQKQDECEKISADVEKLKEKLQIMADDEQKKIANVAEIKNQIVNYQNQMKKEREEKIKEIQSLKTYVDNHCLLYFY